MRSRRWHRRLREGRGRCGLRRRRAANGRCGGRSRNRELCPVGFRVGGRERCSVPRRRRARRCGIKVAGPRWCSTAREGSDPPVLGRRLGWLPNRGSGVRLLAAAPAEAGEWPACANGDRLVTSLTCQRRRTVGPCSLAPHPALRTERRHGTLGFDGDRGPAARAVDCFRSAHDLHYPTICGDDPHLVCLSQGSHTVAACSLQSPQPPWSEPNRATSRWRST